MSNRKKNRSQSRLVRTRFPALRVSNMHSLRDFDWFVGLSVRDWLECVECTRQKLQSLNDKTININVDGVKINQTKHTISRALGLNIDENLS